MKARFLLFSLASTLSLASLAQESKSAISLGIEYEYLSTNEVIGMGQISPYGESLHPYPLSFFGLTSQVRIPNTNILSSISLGYVTGGTTYTDYYDGPQTDVVIDGTLSFSSILLNLNLGYDFQMEGLHVIPEVGVRLYTLAKEETELVITEGAQVTNSYTVENAAMKTVVKGGIRVQYDIHVNRRDVLTPFIGYGYTYGLGKRNQTESRTSGVLNVGLVYAL